MAIRLFLWLLLAMFAFVLGQMVFTLYVVCRWVLGGL